MPDTHLTVVSDRGDLGADRHVVLPTRRIPLLGGAEGWTAAPAWLGGMGQLDPGPADVVASLELFSFGSWQAAELARRLNAPHVVVIAETLSDNPLYQLPPWRQITRRIMRTADAFVCLTELARQHAIALGCHPQRCAVVHPGVDTQAFQPRDGGRTLEPIVLFVGMLRADRGANKGVMEIVSACERLTTEIEGLRLILVGDGHLRPQLAERGRRRPFLEVLGRRPRDEIPTFMRNARVLTLASQRTWKWEEQFGFVLVEAMASGLPVVATSSGAIPEIVPTWNPLVAEGEIAGLEDGLRHALGSRGDEWGRRNRAYVLDHFDLRRQGRVLFGTLSQVTPRT